MSQPLNCLWIVEQDASFYSPTQLCGGGTTKSNSNELPISVPLSFAYLLKKNGGANSLSLSKHSMADGLSSQMIKQTSSPQTVATI